MHDLRKKALIESGKTLSRKARSRESTPGHSKLNTPASSRAASRVRGAGSRAVSDDENDGDLSDETSHRYAVPASFVLFECPSYSHIGPSRF